MDIEQSLVNWLFAAVGCLFGWLMTILWGAIRDLQTDMRQIERDLPEVYVRKDAFKDAVSQIKEDMQAIRTDMRDGFNKIDNTLNFISTRLDSKEDRSKS